MPNFFPCTTVIGLWVSPFCLCECVLSLSHSLAHTPMVLMARRLSSDAKSLSPILLAATHRTKLALCRGEALKLKGCSRVSRHQTPVCRGVPNTRLDNIRNGFVYQKTEASGCTFGLVNFILPPLWNSRRERIKCGAWRVKRCGKLRAWSLNLHEVSNEVS
jgi:hypothetical protein